MEEHLKEILKELLIDNLEIKIKEDREKRLIVELELFGEVISSDFIYT